MPFQPGNRCNPGGRPPETIEVKQVRRLAQAKTHDAFKIIEGLMYGAEKDTVRLAAAIAVLKIAGLRFDSPPETVDITPKPVAQTYSKEQLLAAATGGTN